ncbi:MAG TPA: glycosyltransferase family 4 protein [Thermodesulfovibrionia bacterium]|nr:glycosyltransferase family 4 protein [Thermodesulfovibrionia bacterium]
MKGMDKGLIRLSLIISSLLGGGAERILSTMANYWADKGWQITLMTLVDEHEAQCYKLDPAVNCHAVGIASSGPNPMFRFSNVQRVLRLRHAICQSHPHGVISFLDTVNVLTLITTVGLPFPVIVSERTNPEKYPIGLIWKLLRLMTYPRAARIVVQTERVQACFPGFIRKGISVIPNPIVVPPSDPHDVEKRSTNHRLIAMGRLVRLKGFDILLQAFARIKAKYPDWSLTILGEGVLRPELESMRDALGLAGSVQLPGRVENPYDHLKEADIFILPSRFEGFPNALCEAMACGLPVIAADCLSGPREITGNGSCGILFPPDNVDALASAMDSLMADINKRKALAQLSLTAAASFHIDTIMAMWEQILFDSIAGFHKK